MIRLFAAAVMALVLSGCETDLATMIAGGIKGNCRHTPGQCGNRPDFPAEGPKYVSDLRR